MKHIVDVIPALYLIQQRVFDDSELKLIILCNELTVGDVCCKT